MTKTEFSEKYCKMCGTQRCSGVDDLLFREGCSYYGKEFLNEDKDIVKMQERIYTSLGVPKRLIKTILNEV